MWINRLGWRTDRSFRLGAMPRRPAPDIRERILQTATRLFSGHGVHAIGLQQIIDESGCGKNVLYREFSGKDALVLAVLLRYCEEWERAADTLLGDPGERLVELVRMSVNRAVIPGNRGCLLRSSFAEFPDPAHPVHRLAVRRHNELRARLRELAGAAGAKDPGRLADRLLLIIDGVQVNGPVLGPGGAVTGAEEFARDTIAAALS
ncbi:TetR/AcrR family transcriptional regulator [Pseudonocardiaceae bacterium YIM PH 21723]|nr:TetR/AcrR family transcriptional regulator [Pseudonocardiaceae bacterium YIM PH 21723]